MKYTPTNLVQISFLEEVKTALSDWPKFVSTAGVSKALTTRIARILVA